MPRRDASSPERSRHLERRSTALASTPASSPFLRECPTPHPSLPLPRGDASAPRAPRAPRQTEASSTALGERRGETHAASRPRSTPVGATPMRAREWCPLLGTFSSIDDFVFFSMRAPLWAWPGANPIANSDPTGHADVPKHPNPCDQKCENKLQSEQTRCQKEPGAGRSVFDCLDAALIAYTKCQRGLPAEGPNCMQVAMANLLARSCVQACCSVVAASAGVLGLAGCSAPASAPARDGHAESAVTLVERMLRKYQSCATYLDTGDTRTESVDDTGQRATETITFVTTYRRPRIRFEFETRTGNPAKATRHAFWSTAAGVEDDERRSGGPGTYPSIREAAAAFAGVSHRSAFVPALLDGATFGGGTKFTLIGKEDIDGHTCARVSIGESRGPRNEIWIDLDTFLLRKRVHGHRRGPDKVAAEAITALPTELQTHYRERVLPGYVSETTTVYRAPTCEEAR